MDFQKSLQEYLLPVQQITEEYVEFLEDDIPVESPPQANALDFIVHSLASFSKRALVSKSVPSPHTQKAATPIDILRCVYAKHRNSERGRDSSLARILFPDLGSQLFQMHGRDAPEYSPRELTHNDKHDIYHHALSILTNWGSASLPAQKDCLTALSGIINTVDPENRTLYRNFQLYSDLCIVEDLFLVSETQRNLFAGVLKVLGPGREEDVIRL
ncbi:hypothetical protein BGZ96_012705 [Linnemannia gamsii]|uniref:Uncharacterized protein n=1 Tax=Linnemannia gamsii TaxID=64522 RepID=A0ABQ7KCZ5_9FUNG|nr:hypothetical protein BGZ96_012705 [Linnemannia gamsii]